MDYKINKFEINDKFEPNSVCINIIWLLNNLCHLTKMTLIEAKRSWSEKLIESRDLVPGNYDQKMLLIYSNFETNWKIDKA